MDIVLDKLTDLYWPASASLAAFPLEWAKAHRFIEEMNAAAELGYSDWRLPNRRELRSLICRQSRRPALPGAHPFTQVDRVYWSSITSFYDPDWAWALYLDDGAVGVGQNAFARFGVWAVSDAEYKSASFL